MNDEAVRERLAKALRATPQFYAGSADDLGRALLPVVREIAAEELREAARDVDDGEFSDRWSEAAGRAILARADALTKPPDGPVR